MAILRSVETRRPLALAEDIPLFSGATLFVRGGYLFAPVCLLLGALFLAASRWPRRCGLPCGALLNVIVNDRDQARSLRDLILYPAARWRHQ